MQDYRAFTVLFDGMVDELESQIGITAQPVIGEPPSELSIEVTAIWDTGATGSCIKPWLKDHLNLYTLFDRVPLDGVGGKINACLSFINIQLLCDAWIYDCPVHIIDFPGDADIFIGMDIINMGDFVVCNTDGKTSFSFAIPSLPKRTNFTDEVQSINEQNK